MPGDRPGCYVYGIVPRTVSLPPDIVGVGHPPRPERVALVPHGNLAAVVSEVEAGGLVARPENLVAHQRLLDGIAAHHPVLPLRFGTVLPGPQAVADDLLAPGHDRFSDALATLAGCAQYLVKGRYVQETVLREVLAENPEAAWLRDEVRSVGDADATRNLRLRLGEITSAAIVGKRATDTRVLGDALAPYCVASCVREPVHAEDAVNLALLARTASQTDIEQAAGRVASGWDGRVSLRLLGPMAPYDFARAAAGG